MTKKNNPKILKRKRREILRMLIQIGFLFFAPSIYSAAFTGIKNTVSLISMGKPLEATPFVYQTLAVMALTVFAGRYFCGWACSFGLLGDLVYKLSSNVQRIFRVRLPKLPPKLLALLRYLKYIILLGILALCFDQQSSVITENSPWTAYSMLLSRNMGALKSFPKACALLALLLPGMALQERFFCQCLCPLGAVFSLLPVNPLFQLKRKKENCPSACGACQKVCPVNCLIEEDNPVQGECIQCRRCKTICPRNNIV